MAAATSAIMLELRRGRNRNNDVLVTTETQHEIEIDVLGISGFSVDMSVFAGSTAKKRGVNGVASPDKMKAVIAIFSDGEFCASTGLSNNLKKVWKQSDRSMRSHTSLKDDEFMALWSRRSRSAKVKFDVGDFTSHDHQEPFEVWVALTDGKGEDRTCVSYPIGYGILPFQRVVESKKAILLDLPVIGITTPKDDDSEAGSRASNTENRRNGEDQLQKNQATVGSVYRFDNNGGAMVRLKVQCRRRKQKVDKKMNNLISSISKFRDIPASHHQSESAPILDEDGGSKTFRPIETSSLVSESAYTLGDVAVNRLTSKAAPEQQPQAQNPGSFFETDFPPLDFSGNDDSAKPAFTAPQSAFTAIQKIDASSPSMLTPSFVTPTRSGIRKPVALKATSTPTCSTDSLTKSPNRSEQINGGSATHSQPKEVESPIDLGMIDPTLEEPSELGESRARNRRLRKARKKGSAVVSSGGFHYEAADAGSFAQMDSAAKKDRLANYRIPGEIQTNSRRSSSRTRDDNSQASHVTYVQSIVSKKDAAMNFDQSCGALGNFLEFPTGLVLQKVHQAADNPSVVYDDDQTLSTIETKNSSQIVPWRESVRAYATEAANEDNNKVGTEGVVGGLFDQDNQCGFARHNQCLATISEAAARNESSVAGWWNDIPDGCA